MSQPEPVVKTQLEGLELVNRGKVRDMYALDSRLLIVTTDRISAYDSVLPTAIPWKGKALTHLTEFWLGRLSDITRNHLITTDVGEMGPRVAPHRALLRGRAMLVARADVLPVECVVRGYLAGSAWRDYQREGAICGIALPDGLRECEKLAEPIFTPATKAQSGHDENISFDAMEELIGAQLAREVRRRSAALYERAASYAAGRGVIISDTKFEWGLVEGELTLIDEVLTPDSSRFWPAETYRPGGAQPSFDKQFVRDWLDESGWDHRPPAPQLPVDVVRRTTEKYLQACRQITGSIPAA